MVEVVVEDVLPDGAVVVLDDVVDGGLPLAGAVVVVELELVPEGLVLGGVTVVVVDEEAGGAGGTTTVVELVLGVVVFVSGGVCCWQAPSASSTLAATAV